MEYDKIYYRFYLEHASAGAKRKGQHLGNVIAVKHKKQGRGLAPYKAHQGGPANDLSPLYYALASIDSRKPNCRVSDITVTWDFIRENCKRVSLSRAKEIHPVLFEEAELKNL